MRQLYFMFEFMLNSLTNYYSLNIFYLCSDESLYLFVSDFAIYPFQKGGV